jgi:drug/metabolite transporter (DMT)-like permease
VGLQRRLIRQLSSSVSTATQMLLNNSVFLVLCAAVAPWWWQLPSGRELMLMALVGIAGCAAQYLLYDGIRRAPASVVAPLEYTGLLWSFILGFAIWGDVPAPAVFMGAGLICASGLPVIAFEWRAARTTAGPTPATATSPGFVADMPIAGSHPGS